MTRVPQGNMDEFMEKLFSCIDEGERHCKEDEAKTCLHRILSNLQSELSIDDRRVALNTFFHEEKGIQAFLRACVKSDAKKISSDVLSIFLYLLETDPSSLKDYVVIIKDECLQFIKREGSAADEKVKSLEVLNAIVRLGPWVADIGAQSIISQLMRMASHKLSKPTVLCKVYSLIGAMAEHLPQHVQAVSKRLLHSLMIDFNYQINITPKVQNQILEGCCDGLSGLLVSFPLHESSASDVEICGKISSFIKKILKAYRDRGQRTAARASLNLLARHGDLLQANLVSEYQDWHQTLQNWLSIGKEERAAAKDALLTFYYVLSTFISRNNKMDMLPFFSDYFKSQFEKSENVDIAIKGFGLFARPIKLHLPAELPGIFNILSQRSQEECGKGNHHRLADYLDSLSVLSAESGIIHSLQLAILEKLSVELLSQFALEEHPVWQTVMVDAVISTLLRLSQTSGHALDMYLKTFVYQGIIRSVSNPLVEDAEILRETEKQKVTTYRNYLPFWHCVITLSQSLKRKSCLDASISEKIDLSKKILDRVLESIVEIVNRLDLSLKENVSPELIYHCDMKKCIGATNPLDFTVLVNLVNFTFDLLSNLPDQSYLEKWISPLLKLNIVLSTKHPLVSSFYKFLTCVILIAQKLDYFQHQEDEMKDVDWKPTINLLSGFLTDVIVRQTQYRDELQVACLRLMLATPSCIAQPMLSLSVPAFQSVFRIGCSMLSLAQEGLRTLARWNQEISDEKMKPLLKAVLPSFDILLRTRDNVALDRDEEAMAGMALVKKVLQDRKKKKLWKQKINTQYDTELVQLQKEVILFLSTLDSSSYLSLLDGSEDRVGVTAWQKEKLLLFPLPFPDMKVDISLDDILPRLVDLALNCSDRQTRSASCELLHAVIMFMLGKEKQLESTQQGHLTALWTHVFPCILSLACDMDSMVKQLFMPLGEEMAHWYSSKSQERSKQASAFLEALLKGITHQTDAALRDYSAGCLHEYALWSRKQGHMVAKVEPVIKFVSSLCHHPCPQKRMGAALAFNSLYSVLREDERIVDEFWVELLHSLVTSFSMCSVTGDDSNTETQTNKSLQHILRVFIECSSKFNQDSINRRIPSEIGGRDLAAVVRWLLRYCTTLNSACRHSCMNLVDRLSGYVSDCCSTKDIILKLVNGEGGNCLLEIAEGEKGLSTTLSKCPAWDQALAWVYSLLASMESYMWLVNSGISAEILFNMMNSNLLQALMSFSEGIVQSVEPIINKREDGGRDQDSLWRPKELENVNVAKCCTIVRMIEFLTVVLQKGQISGLNSFWSPNFWHILTYCCIRPSIFGFDSTSKSVEENLPSIVEKFLKTISEKFASTSTLEDLKEHLQLHLSSMAADMLGRFPESIRNNNVSLKDKDLVRGLRVLHSVFEEAQSWTGLTQEASLRVVFQSIVEPVANSELDAPVSLGPLALEYATSMLQLHFTTTPDVKPLILLAQEGCPLYQRNIKGDLTHGEHFVLTFRETIAKRLLNSPVASIQIIAELLSPDIHPQNLTVLQSVLRSHCRPKSATWNHLKEFIECLFLLWSKFATWAQGDSNKEDWLISLLVQIVQLDFSFHSIRNCELICSWIEKVLMDSSKSLAQKTGLLQCLPLICSHSKEDEVKALLQSLQDDHFPLQSSEFKTGTEELSNFKRAFEVLLKSLIVTGSCAILQMIIKMMARDEKHTCRHLLPDTLENFMNCLTDKPARQFESLNLVFKMFDGEMLFISTRLCILQDFLLKLFMHASIQGQKLFAKSVIQKLLSSIKSRVKIEDADKMRQKLVSQLGSWSLLQQIYGIPERSLFDTPGSELLLAAFHGSKDVKVTTGKELTAHLLKRAMDAFQFPPNFDSVPADVKELFRQYLCAVYNVSVTIICNLKTESTDGKFYEKFLFDESTKKVWRLLVDENRQYLLSFHHTEHLQKVEKVTSIRQKIAEGKAAARGDGRKSLQFFESQSFAGSLESDITRFDFSHSRLLKVPGGEQHMSEKTVIELESDPLNNHECMATVCGVIRHLVDSAITPVPSVTPGDAPDLPGWMVAFKNSLVDPACPRNSLIFILRVIINCEPYFSPYAEGWIKPILDCAVRTCLNDGISYLLGDIICLLAKWTADNPSVQIPAGQANRLFHHLVAACPCVEQSVFKYHLELIKSCLEVWKNCITPPYDTLENLLKYPERKVGINLTAIMLFYDLVPWTSESKRTFMAFLLNNLRDSRKTIFKASSELIGLCLKQMAEEVDYQLLEEELVTYLKSVHSKERDCDRFLTVLYGVHDTFPQIADSFIPVIRYYLDQTSDDRKALCLCLLSKHLDHFHPNPFQQLNEHNLLALLSSRNSNVQMKAFGIISVLATQSSDDELYEVIQEISNINSLIKGEARQLLYEISLTAFDRCISKQETGTLSEKEEKIYNESKAILLLGLVDSNVELQRKCFNKWTEEERLPARAPERLTTIFSLMYSPSTEEHFLSYSVPLMLQGTAVTPDFQSTVFQHGLDVCEYQNHDVNAHWVAKNVPMAPMFAQTMTSQYSSSSSSSMNESTDAVLVTQDSLMFEPTADFVDGSDTMNQSKFGDSMVQSSFLFSPGEGTFNSQRTSSSKKLNYKQGHGFGNQRLRFVNQNESETGPTESRSSLRFNRYLGKNSASKVFGMANVRKANMREEAWKNRARKRESQVKLHRRYRKGDLPDIQIKFADFINPLMELAKRDTIIAQKVIVSLFTGVKTMMQACGNFDPFHQQAATLLKNVLEMSTTYSPSTIGACLEIAYHCQFTIDSLLVSEAALGSDLLASGVLLLESNILNNEEPNQEETWLKLAELYDGLGERDVAHAVMLHEVQLGEAAKCALEAHAEEQWHKAKKNYFSAINERDCDNFFLSCFECMAIMSEWGDINKIIRKDVADEECGLDKLWNDRWSMKNLLPRLLHSEVLSLIQENKDKHKFLKVINTWLLDKDKGAALQGNFCETLSILCLIKKEFVKSQFFGSKTLSKFIDDWNDLNPLFRKRRETLLMSINSIAEVMGVFAAGEGELPKAEEECKVILSKLERIAPLTEDNLMQWETRISYRIACMRCFPEEMQAVIQESAFNMQLSLVETALLQGNQEFAKKYLECIRTDTQETIDCLASTRLQLARCRERHLFVEKNPNGVQRLDDLIKIWSNLDKIVAEKAKDTELIISAHRAESNLSFSIQQLISGNQEPLQVLKMKEKGKYTWLCGKLQLSLSSTSSEFVASLENIGLNSLVYSKNEITKHQESQRMLGDVHLQIAQYCRKILENREDVTSSDVTFTLPMVKATLSAMKCQSSRARQLFPLLLQLQNLSTDLAKDFKKLSGSVPPWMFLGWIPQMLPLLDTPAVDVIGPLLLKIAEKYPNAVTYPYNISRKKHLSQNVSNLKLIKELDSLLESNSIQTQLVRALSCLTYPSIIIKDFYDQLKEAMSSTSIDWNFVQQIIDSVFREVLDDCSGQHPAYTFSGRFFNSLEKAGMHELFVELRDAVRIKSKALCDKTLQKVLEAYKIASQLDGKMKHYSKLKDFSIWLAEFSSSKMNVSIEIPGQYAGDQRPTPERHVMISRFEENVQVMQSIRRPVKLTIIGSDSSSNTFLVKYGEDLRQDERVQQLLSLMNGVFAHNPICRERHLSVVTYKVVPLSSNLGIIGWVDNTSTLKELMLSPLSDEEKQKMKMIAAKHLSWVNEMNGLNPKQRFGNAHKQKRTKSVAQFQQLVALMQPDVVRKSLASWSSSAEAFYWLRHSFITSYSTLCITHWLLGVGDRHLSNCLVSERTGQCIGIDFGHSFGSATQFLPVPELVPFRLTPHIVNLAKPHGTKGLIEETMVRALRALQADPEVLLATMQVFIQEPSLDWLVKAKKDFAERGDNPSWLPVLKIQQAKRKLKGVNPTIVMEEDLQGSQHNEFRKAYLCTLKGQSDFNIRNRLGHNNLTPRQQVQCLIDLATDENVLVKMWHGWEPWM